VAWFASSFGEHGIMSRMARKNNAASAFNCINMARASQQFQGISNFLGSLVSVQGEITPEKRDSGLALYKL
jgi:hypothetical protein